MLRRWLNYLLNYLVPLACVFGSCAGAWAQSTVTATVTDSDSTAWATLNSYNATYSIQLISSAGQPVPAGQAFVASTGAAVTNPAPGNLSSSGALSVSLYNNSLITPANTKWQFTVCPAVSSPVCATTALTISGSGSVSSQLSAATLPPRIGGGQGSYAYADVEVAAIPNNSYYNITTPAIRCYAAAWAVCGAGGGGPPSGAAGGALGGTYPNPTVVNAINPSSTGATTPGTVAATSVTDSNWTQGEPLYPSSAGLLGSSPAYLDCSKFDGADDSLKIQACFVALDALNAQAGVADARGLTGLTWSVNPFAASSIPASGILLLPAGNTTVSVPVVPYGNWSIEGTTVNASNGTNYGIGSAVIGSVLQASSSFPQTYSTGTVTVGTAGASDVITGSGTTWNTTNNAVGCAFVAPAGGLTGNMTYGVISAITSTTSITLGWGVTIGSGAAGGSTYDIYCPVYTAGNGLTGCSGNNGFCYGMALRHLALDANNRTGVIPYMNWFGGQHTYAEDVNLYNFTSMGFALEGKYAQNSGPYSRMDSYPGTSAGASTLPFVVDISGGFFGMSNLSVNKGTSSTNPSIGIDIEGTGILITNVDAEQVGVGVSINNSTTCTPACLQGPFQLGSANNIEVDEVHGSGTTAVHLASNNGLPRSVILRDIQSGSWTNTLIDATGCTDTASTDNGLAQYVTNPAGQIVASTSSIAACAPLIQGSGFTSGGTKFSVSGCGTATSLVGGSTAGKFVGASATCTPVVTTGLTAPNGYACSMQDETTSTAAFRQTAYSATTATFTAGGTVGATDTIVFHCFEF